MEQEKKLNKNLSLKWFNVYVNILLPLAIIAGVFDTTKAIKFAIHIIPRPPYEFIEFTFIGWPILTFILVVILFIGLKKKKLWAWKLNFIYLILNIFAPYLYALSIGNTNFRISSIYWFLALLIVWVIPNWIYFKKRKYLFSQKINNQ